MNLTFALCLRFACVFLLGALARTASPFECCWWVYFAYSVATFDIEGKCSYSPPDSSDDDADEEKR